ncbi:hypothetical protein INP75_29070 [Bacillus toyonensis]|nr:hypothetical protein [Bacillus toyonensis]
MLFTGFFINLSIFSFLASSAIFIQVFIRKMDYKFIHLIWGTYAGIIAAILMIFNFKWDCFMTCEPFLLLFRLFILVVQPAGLR